jgi:uncharacterized protein YndB with AHSA1/START domain
MVGYPFDNWLVVNDNSNQVVVKEAAMHTEVRREVDVEATPEEVWEALVTEQGRERWLEGEDLDRAVHIESAEPPNHLVWWWGSEDRPATRVAFQIVELPHGTRVRVTETSPSLPLQMLASSFRALVAA